MTPAPFHSDVRCPHLGDGECPRLAISQCGGDDLHDQLTAAIRIIARDNGIDVAHANQLVAQELKAMGVR